MNEPGYEQINVHMIFDIKMDGKFTEEEILMADVHTKSPPLSLTYSGVVSRESVRIVFLLASINYLDIFACDLSNACHNDK